jgi:hypothetical protein
MVAAGTVCAKILIGCLRPILVVNSTAVSVDVIFVAFLVFAKYRLSIIDATLVRTV